MAIRHWLYAGDLHEAALAHAQPAASNRMTPGSATIWAYASLAERSRTRGDLRTALAARAELAKSNPNPKNLLDYGIALGDAGFHAQALEQFDAVVAMASDDIDLLASCLVNRGVVKGMAGDLPGELADYTAVAELTGAPEEQVAKALLNRGVAKGMAADLPGALADFTAVVELQGHLRSRWARLCSIGAWPREWPETCRVKSPTIRPSWPWRERGTSRWHKR